MQRLLSPFLFASSFALSLLQRCGRTLLQRCGRNAAAFGMICFLALATTWSCDPSIGSDGPVQILDGSAESAKESSPSEPTTSDSSEPTTEIISEHSADDTTDAASPEESAQIESSTESFTEPSHELVIEPSSEAMPESSNELPQENAAETAPSEEATSTEPATEPRSESPPPDPVGVSCQVQGVQGTCLRTTDCATPNKPIAGYCPGPSDIQCCVPPSTNPVCDPNVQPQPNIGITEPAGLGGCPAGMTRVSTFCIDRWEAFLVEVLPNGQTQPWSPYFNPGTRKIRALSAPNAVPQGYINGDQAKLACIEAGKRLCTDQEWLRACQGPNGWTYPYGNTRQPGVCNDARSVHPAVEYFQSSDPSVFSKIQHQCLNQLPQSLAKTGAKIGCITAEGVSDMMGNLHEWTSDPAGTFRGGFYVDTYRNGNGCLYRTTAHTTPHWDYSTGFRCCANIP